MNPPEEKLKEITRKLAEPFPPEDVRFLPLGKAYQGTISVAAFVDARSVAERLNEVMGLNCWQDEYDTLAQGEVRCKLSLKLEGEWVHRCDVGSMSEQPDMGDRCKAAHSDALKRAAVKFGVGLYLYRIKGLRGDHDGHKVTRWPVLPTWAVPEMCQPAGKEFGARLGALIAQASAKAKCDHKGAIDRLLKRYDYAGNTALADLERRHARSMLQDVNDWIGDLNKPTVSGEQKTA